MTSRTDVELMQSLALPFARRVLCACFGWPVDLAGTLIDWTRRNQTGTRGADRAALTAIVGELEPTVAGPLRSRRADADEPDWPAWNCALWWKNCWPRRR